jgi:TPR repeat protein
MAEPAHFLFVSHVTEDRAAALEIVEDLEGRGIPCWIAPRNIHPGRPFDDEIVAAIESSRAILLIFSDLCNESEYIRREVTVAGESQKLIIPLRIEDAQPRRGLRVRLSDLHWLDGFVARERAIDELVRRFGPAAEPWARHQDERQGAVGQAAEAGAAPHIAAPPAKGRHAVLVVALAFAAVLVGAAGWWWSGRLGEPSGNPIVPATEAVSKGKAAIDRHDYGQALRWYRQAADEGDATAQTTLGYLYEKGLGVPQSYGDALAWYRKAAAQGHAAAERNIGTLYEQGRGVPLDYAEALGWYRRAAEHGNAGAQTNVGYLYERGLGVPQDYAEALRWYRMAAEHGEAMAQNNIGTFYDKGYGVAQDYSGALRWYRRAAEQGNIDAEYNLALLYADGRGVTVDLAEARAWMQKAAGAGDPEARKWLEAHGG